MNIIVCVKEIIDPELTPDNFDIDQTLSKAVDPESVPNVLSPFDEQAVEAALRIKDAMGGKITVLSLGDLLHREVVKKPLGMGADELILLEDNAFADGDSWSTAYALAMAISKIGNYDIIICGRQAADWDNGQVGSGIAEILGIPSVTIAKKIEAIDGKIRVERIIEDGYEIIETCIPVLITVSNEIGQARYGTLDKIMEAANKEPTIWKAKDIGVAPHEIGNKGRRIELLKLYKPIRESKCEIIERTTLEESAVALAQRLREAKIL